MLKINPQVHLFLFLWLNYILYGAAIDYNPYVNKQQHHLLHATNSANDGYNAQQAAFNENTAFPQNLQGNSNYQQLYRYYYTPPYQQQQQQQISQPQQPTQIWSGPPIVVEDDIQQQQQSSNNIPPTFYQQHSSASIKSSSELLPFLHKNSKALTPTIYNPQPTTPTTQAYFYNNNNNIIYHRDFRHDINAMPETQHTQQQDNMISWNNRQQQNQLLEQQQEQQQKQPPEFYTSDTNVRYNGISNDLHAASFREVKMPDYREHFKRYLENNPRRIRPIY